MSVERHLVAIFAHCSLARLDGHAASVVFGDNSRISIRGEPMTLRGNILHGRLPQSFEGTGDRIFLTLLVSDEFHCLRS